MDFSYAPPPPRKRVAADSLENAKRVKSDLLDGLPTHLPNTTPAKVITPPVCEELKPEEPKPANTPIFIEGTNITLQTEEDIAKWIEERRKRWPTRKNIEEKKAQQQSVVGAPKETTLPRKQICKFFSRNRKCKFGTKCKNSHELANNNAQSPVRGSNVKVINGLKVAVPQRYSREAPTDKSSGSLFKKLVQRDLFENQNNVVMDFLLYLDARGIIDKEAVI